MIKFKTNNEDIPVLAEPKSKLPDMCRQSDFVPLPTLLERFIASGARYTEYMSAQALSVEEKEKLWDSNDVADLAEMDLVDQKAFIDQAVEAAKQESEVVQEPTQAEKQVEPEKPETAENA